MSKSQFPEVPSNKWPPEQEALLRKHYATMPIPELMELLGKTKTAIYGKAHTLGLTRIDKTVRHEGQNFTIGQPRVVVLKNAVPTVVREAPVRNSTAKGTYSGAELQPFAGRPGAMDAYSLPSVLMGKREYRCARFETAETE